MGVLKPMHDEEEVEEGAYEITTKMVITWKHRIEKGGWFRRARLVARQCKWSIFTDEAFAPTSAYGIVKLMLHRALMDRNMGVRTVDIKDAFLMVDQPTDEKAMVTRDGKKYKLGKVLPGQRTAASKWFHEFKEKAAKYGMESDSMQPTLMRMKKKSHEEGHRLYATIHVDDLMLVGDEALAMKFLGQKTKVGSWKRRGPLGSMKDSAT